MLLARLDCTGTLKGKTPMINWQRSVRLFAFYFLFFVVMWNDCRGSHWITHLSQSRAFDKAFEICW